jgi:hypothetical protein
MNDTGQDMRATLLAGSSDMPPGIDLLHGLEDRAAARRRRRIRTLVPAGAVAVAAAVTTTLLATSVTNPPSALAAVTAAMVKTSAQSYRFSLNSALTFTGRPVSSRMSFSGAIDPRGHLGAETLITSPAKAQLRFIGKYVYTWVNIGSRLLTPGPRHARLDKPWDKAPIPTLTGDTFPGSDLKGLTADRPISPADLLGVLRSAAVVRKVGPVSGRGWTGTEYAFTAHPAGENEITSVVAAGQAKIVGVVDVDQQGQVRVLATTTTIPSLTSPGRPALVGTERLTFGDFGAPVSVSPPPAGQVEYTSTPYWVFVF